MLHVQLNNFFEQLEDLRIADQDIYERIPVLRHPLPGTAIASLPQVLTYAPCAGLRSMGRGRFYGKTSQFPDLNGCML